MREEEDAMENDALKIRWLVDQCYEIITREGKHILIDPGITSLGRTEENLTLLDSIKACDYVLVTHSHYASVADLRDLMEKFNPFVFMPVISAHEVFSYFDLDYSRLHPLHHGRRYELDGLTFEAYVGKHGGSKHFKDRLSHMDDEIAGSAFSLANVLGNVESFDFAMTFSDNLRLMYVSGEDDVKNNYSIAQNFCPNVLIRQYLNWPLERYAAAIDRFHAEVAIGGHHDRVFKNDLGKMDALGSQVAAALKEMGSSTTYVCPETSRWYTLGTRIEML